MEASAEKTTPSEMGMGRPSDETLAEEDDEPDIKNRIIPHDFESPENKSGPSVHMLEDWLEHEAERLRPIHISLSESSDALAVRADVPGVKEADLRIRVQPDRVMITRKPAIGKRFGTGLSVSCPGEKSRVIELPSPVTVNKVRIAVKDEVLELDLAKVEPAKQEGIEPKTV
jgi:HSP20 family molecular chaperone IbpA